MPDSAPPTLIKQLGPGLVTGAADDDPSGIATYSQAGAQFGYQMLWTVLLTYPLMVGIQLISARLGYVTGRGLAANIKAIFPAPVLYGVVGLLLIANTINIAADIAAMGEATTLLVGGSPRVYALIIGVVCLALEIFLRYQQYVGYLKVLTLALLSYVAVVFMVHVRWLEVLRSVTLPAIAFDHDTIWMVVAVFGTTISPYMFFWQAAQEMEDLRTGHNGLKAKRLRARAAPTQLRRIRWDTYVGMGFSNLVAFFIILSAAATLHLAGITNIQTSAQAAEALRPLGGQATFLLFTAGIVGTGMLAVPVLAGSAAYAITESLELRTGLDLKWYEAKEFYALIVLATLGGTLLNFTRLDPIRALLWSAEINGVIAVPIMVVMMHLGANRKLMGNLAIGSRLRFVGWAATIIMGLTVAAMFSTL